MIHLYFVQLRSKISLRLWVRMSLYSLFLAIDFFLSLCFVVSFFHTFRFLIDHRFKGTISQIFMHNFLFFLYNLLNFVILPNLIPLQKSWVTGNQVAFIFCNSRLKSALNIYFDLNLISLLISLFHRVETLLIKMVPYWLWKSSSIEHLIFVHGFCGISITGWTSTVVLWSILFSGILSPSFRLTSFCPLSLELIFLFLSLSLFWCQPSFFLFVFLAAFNSFRWLVLRFAVTFVIFEILIIRFPNNFVIRSEVLLWIIH